MIAKKNSKKQDLVISRSFDVPLSEIWKAWTDSNYIMQWWGPNHFTCPSVEIDFRVGKTSLLCMRAPKDFVGQDMYSTWTYKKIVPMKQIEYIHNLADKNGKKMNPIDMGMPSDFPQDQRHVITFKTINDNKTELTVKEYGWTVGQMMDMSKMGMEQCLDKMATIFVKA